MAERSKKLFFVSECLVNQNIRAYGVKNMVGEGPVAALLQEFIQLGVGIAVVPCPEIAYEGLRRFACGKARYANDEYSRICMQLADDLVSRYKMYLDDDYAVGGFICVNGSPSCAVDYCYCDYAGTTKCLEGGVFIECVKQKLAERKLSLRFIGYHKKNVEQVICNIREAASDEYVCTS